MTALNLEQIFHNARTHNAWLDRPVSDALLKEIYHTMQWGPTSANCLPARIVFLKPGPKRDPLYSCLMPANVEKTKTAPATAILAYDKDFFENLPKLFPHTDARSWFTGNPVLALETAVYNSALQHAYFIIAARALGLDCGPMAGFNKAEVDAAFLQGTTWKSSLIVNIGYGDASKLFPRSPRLDFSEACVIKS